MEIILLERVAKLGAMGEVVKVRDGFARNFLLRQGKALRATDANKTKFERDRHTVTNDTFKPRGRRPPRIGITVCPLWLRLPGRG